MLVLGCQSGVNEADVRVSTLVRNVRNVDLNAILGTIFPIFFTLLILIGAVTRILYKLCTVWVLNLFCVYVHLSVCN